VSGTYAVKEMFRCKRNSNGVILSFIWRKMLGRWLGRL